MTVLRHYLADGKPAYLTYWKRAPEGTWTFLRLVYKTAEGFGTAWDNAVEELEGTLDGVIST